MGALHHPDQVWVADITYVQLCREDVYLAVLMDVFSLTLGLIGPVLVTGFLRTGVGRIDLLGAAAATGAGVFYTIPLFIGRKLKGRVSGRTQVWFGTGLGALVTLPFAAFSLPVALGQLPLGIPYLLIF